MPEAFGDLNPSRRQLLPSCKDQAPKSSSSRPIYSWESEQQGVLGEGRSWEGPQESISSRQRACRINFFLSFFPSYLQLLVD